MKLYPDDYFSDIEAVLDEIVNQVDEIRRSLSHLMYIDEENRERGLPEKVWDEDDYEQLEDTLDKCNHANDILGEVSI